MSDYSLYRDRIEAYGSTIREGRILSTINKINSAFKDSPSYFEVTINNADTQVGVHIVDDSTSTTTANDNTKYIIMKPGDNLAVGDLVYHSDSDWLCIACEKFGDMYYKGKIQEVVSYMQIDIGNNLYNLPICIENSRYYQLGEKSSKYLLEPSSEIMARVADNNISQAIKRNQIYTIGEQNYRVVDIRDLLEPGILLLKMIFSADSQELPSYVISVLNGTSVAVVLGQTLALNVKVYEGGNLITPSPTLIYLSDDEEVATVDNDGVITPVEIGNTSIFIKYGGTTTTVTLNVLESVVDDYSVSILAEGEQGFLGYTYAFSATVFNNGTADDSKDVVWSISNVDDSSNQYAQIITQDGDSATIKLSNNYDWRNKVIKIRATCGDVFDEITFKLATFF